MASRIMFLLALGLAPLSGKAFGAGLGAHQSSSTARVESLAEGEEYKIHPLDVLQISVYQEPDMDRIARVSASGSITFPLLGSVPLAGLTLAEAEAKLQSLLGGDYLIRPQVTIFMKEYRTKRIFVLGEVKRPGSFEIPSETRLTVLEAVTLAGGFTEYASRDKARVIRVVKGETVHIPVKVYEITRGGDRSRDVMLEPNDVIFIPEGFF